MHKFTFLFLATKPGDKALPVTLRTTADTEEAARADFPGWDLTFAAKIRTESPVFDSWVDGESHTLWTLQGTDVSYVREMVGGAHA